MQRCEIMLNDLIDSKRTNSNIKATITQPFKTGIFKSFTCIFAHSLAVESSCVSRCWKCLSIGSDDETGLSLDILDATIISTNFWPPIQVQLSAFSITLINSFFGEMEMKHIEILEHHLA